MAIIGKGKKVPIIEYANKIYVRPTIDLNKSH